MNSNQLNIILGFIFAFGLFSTANAGTDLPGRDDAHQQQTPAALQQPATQPGPQPNATLASRLPDTQPEEQLSAAAGHPAGTLNKRQAGGSSVAPDQNHPKTADRISPEEMRNFKRAKGALLLANLSFIAMLVGGTLLVYAVYSDIVSTFLFGLSALGVAGLAILAVAGLVWLVTSIIAMIAATQQPGETVLILAGLNLGGPLFGYLLTLVSFIWFWIWFFSRESSGPNPNMFGDDDNEEPAPEDNRGRETESI